MFALVLLSRPVRRIVGQASRTSMDERNKSNVLHNSLRIDSLNKMKAKLGRGQDECGKPGKVLKNITMAEIEKHTKDGDAWVIFQDKVETY